MHCLLVFLFEPNSAAGALDCSVEAQSAVLANLGRVRRVQSNSELQGTTQDWWYVLVHASLPYAVVHMKLLTAALIALAVPGR
jgi:hypothetical protein